jgi:hypothetical protein
VIDWRVSVCRPGYSLNKHNPRNIKIHNATCVCIIDCMTIRQSVTLSRSFPKLGFFAEFSL